METADSWKEHDSELPSSVSLWSVAFLAEPTKLHPKFYELEFGLLEILLYASNGDDASYRARKIFRQLPWYESLSDWTRTFFPGEQTPSENPQFPMFVQTAKEFGIAIFFGAFKIGADADVDVAIKAFERH